MADYNSKYTGKEIETILDDSKNPMKGATASASGKTGLVPAPAAGKQTSFLRGDGTWVIPTNTTYGLSSTTANGLLRQLTGSTTTFMRGDGTWATPAYPSSVSGNAGSATKLQTARTITLSGGVTGSTSTDFSGNVTISTTLSSFDASKITSGTISIDRLPKAALERLYLVADDKARFALTADQVQNGDTVKVTATGHMYMVKDQTKLSTEDGYEPYTASQASSVPWSGVTGKPSTFYTLPTATASALGGIKVGYATSGKNYKIQLDASGNAYVNVPWTDTNTTYANMTAATASAAGKAGLVPAPAAGKQTSFLRGDGAWVVPTNTTYGVVTTTANGLMIASDKVKLDGIAPSANNYTLPTATSSVLGGVKTGTGLANSSGTISVSYGTAAGTACQGNDSRLSNSRPASDVSAWAKASSKPTYTAAEVGALASSGTAAASTKLATARTINGTAFNGTANIITSNWGTTRALTIGGSAKSVNGSGNVAWTRTEIGAANGWDNSATTPATAQWYRIAVSAVDILNNVGTFYITGAVSGQHTNVVLQAGVSYGVAASVNLMQMMCSNYSSAILTKARLVYHTTYSGNYAYLEVYMSTAKATKIDVRFIGGGWRTIAPNTVGSIPSGYANKEITFNGGANYIVGNLQGSVSGNATSASKVGNNMVIKITGGTTEGTNLYTYNGSAAKTLNVVAGSNITLTPTAGQLTIAAKNTTYGVVGANGSTGLVKNGSTVTSASGFTACPIVGGVPYYKDTNTTYAVATASANGLMPSGVYSNLLSGRVVTSSTFDFGSGGQTGGSGLYLHVSGLNPINGSTAEVGGGGEWNIQVPVVTNARDGLVPASYYYMLDNYYKNGLYGQPSYKNIVTLNPINQLSRYGLWYGNYNLLIGTSTTASQLTLAITQDPNDVVCAYFCINIKNGTTVEKNVTIPNSGNYLSSKTSITIPAGGILELSVKGLWGKWIIIDKQNW